MEGLWGAVSHPKSCGGKVWGYNLELTRNTLGKKVEWTCPPQSTPWRRP